MNLIMRMQKEVMDLKVRVARKNFSFLNVGNYLTTLTISFLTCEINTISWFPSGANFPWFRRASIKFIILWELELSFFKYQLLSDLYLYLTPRFKPKDKAQGKTVTNVWESTGNNDLILPALGGTWGLKKWNCFPEGSICSSLHRILQARILAWIAISSSKGSSWPRDQTCISLSPALAGGFFATSTTWESQY